MAGTVTKLFSRWVVLIWYQGGYLLSTWNSIAGCVTWFEVSTLSSRAGRLHQVYFLPEDYAFGTWNSKEHESVKLENLKQLEWLSVLLRQGENLVFVFIE
jgi:hypothetical protein